MRMLAVALVTLLPAIALAQDPYYYQQDPYAQAQPVEPAAYQYGYVGPHPEPYEYGNAPCYQMGAHFHPYPPFDQYVFREANGYFYFVGDLGDFGYSGQLWGYQGNHPFPVENGGGFCYISWPHRHHFPAPASLPFRWAGGYYTYYGPWDPAYYANRDAWNAYYNGYYRTSYYGGRYWTVRPQPVYRPSYGWGHRGVYRPGMTVVGPSGGSITVTGPGWGHHPGHPGYVAPGHTTVVAPPPGRPTVVGPPPGRPTVVAPPPSRPQVVAPPPGPQRRPVSGGVVIPPPR